MTMNGTSTQFLTVINPATGVAVAEVPVCHEDQLDAAFTAAALAWPAWARDESLRRSLMGELKQAIGAAREELVSLLVLETGKPPGLAGLDITASELWLEYFSEIDMPRVRLHDDESVRIDLGYRPLGVVAAIVPWNFPIASAMCKIAPALRAGDTVVVKPSPFTPLATARLGEIIGGVLPSGIVQVVIGDDELGAAMTRHPVPRKVSFTGSIAAGKKVAMAAGADLKRVTLELGGNDAAILLDDVDIASVVPSLLARAFFNTGQACALPKRIFVPETIYDDAMDAFCAAASAIRLGTDSDSDMGPLATRPQFDRICDLVDDALAAGSTPVVGGKPVDGPGYFFQPTIFRGADDGQRIVDEEQFGPVLPVLSYRTLDEAVRRANQTMFGLCGSVWGTDTDRAAAVAERLECGVSYVNAHGVHGPYMPMPGAKWSGVGIENGIEGLLEFTQRHVMFQARRPTQSAMVD
jgi:acyl-CoA reductase-like NAD-dependent aldehyde dehydrogenase